MKDEINDQVNRATKQEEEDVQEELQEEESSLKTETFLSNSLSDHQGKKAT
jgi:hypothetical protein